MVTIKETDEKDLPYVQKLWADGNVMRYVGFPQGLQQTEEEMKAWLAWIVSSRPLVNHYSVYEDGVYCGESFYSIDEAHDNAAAMDIKLFRLARGRGIAAKALSFAIGEAFRNGAEKVWVDPNPENRKALALYERLGFVRRPMPAYLQGEETAAAVYMERTRK